jgi:hypothetical protein
MNWQWSPERQQIWLDQYNLAFPEGEDILAAAQLWLDYLGDGQKHVAIRLRSFVFAKRLLHLMLSGPGGSHYKMGDFWRERVGEFGLRWHPETNEIEVIDRWRWMHAVSILRQTWRLPYVTFLNRLASGCHYDDYLSYDELPPKKKGKRRQLLDQYGTPVYSQPNPVDREQETAYNPIQSFLSRLTEDM